MSERKVPRFGRRIKLQTEDETTYYRYVRTLDGSLQPADTIRQSGQDVLRFVPESRQESETGCLADFLEFYRILMYNLSQAERRIWLSLLRGRTMDEVARAEGIKRSAVYARIRGNRGRGGMIRKNWFVLAWWLAGKNKVNQHK